MKLGNRLKRFRFEHDSMSQEALANAVGVTRQTIIALEKGKYMPSSLLALKLARFFDTAVEEIFFLVDED